MLGAQNAKTNMISPYPPVAYSPEEETGSYVKVSVQFDKAKAEVSRPHPSDHPLLILFVVGGVTVSEAKMIKDLVSTLKPGTQVIVLSTRLLKPLNIPELLFATDRLHPDLGF
ncbi:Sec1 family domain-containing protein 2 [Camelus dromedarius]|uniref:Sec1 family domain-containing protein 2 n=1 Tax=Camelus dromedarius TaxID=9838 RepID=A0A5N4EGY0_CAMDR|nr:Sec1 family domain-containing protein 2 [Camelus dromedarius]